VVGPIARAILGAVQKRTTPATESLEPESVED